MTTASPEYLRADAQLRRARTALRAAIRRHVRGTRGEQNAVLNLVQPVINAAVFRSTVTRRPAGLDQAVGELIVAAQYARNDARQVLDNWESGDLAGAVSGLTETAEALDAALDALARIQEPVL